jgi:hypothetical protein
MNEERMESTENGGAISSQRPKVVSAYSGYTPPFDVVPIVERMIESVPARYLVGLSEVVLTNSSGLSRKLRRAVTKARKRKYRILECRGLYHQAWHGKPAWIEMFVDNALKGWEKGLWLKVPFIREGRLSEVLFHEVGHHIHFTTRPEYREKEDVADVWKVRLERNYTRRRFRLLRAFVRLFQLLFGKLFERVHSKLMQGQLNKGWISRAEFDERVKLKKARDQKAPLA